MTLRRLDLGKEILDHSEAIFVQELEERPKNSPPLLVPNKWLFLLSFEVSVNFHWLYFVLEPVVVAGGVEFERQESEVDVPQVLSSIVLLNLGEPLEMFVVFDKKSSDGLPLDLLYLLLLLFLLEIPGLFSSKSWLLSSCRVGFPQSSAFHILPGILGMESLPFN